MELGRRYKKATVQIVVVQRRNTKSSGGIRRKKTRKEKDLVARDADKLLTYRIHPMTLIACGRGNNTNTKLHKFFFFLIVLRFKVLPGDQQNSSAVNRGVKNLLSSCRSEAKRHHRRRNNERGSFFETLRIVLTEGCTTPREQIVL